MTMSMSAASLPVIRHYLSRLSQLLTKADKYVAARNIKADALLGARLYPDMYPLVGQVQLACDFAKGAIARLAGVTNPGFADEEETFADLQARIDKTLDFIDTIAPALIDGSEERPIALKFGKYELAAEGRDYLTGFALPNLMFHVSMAYAILRHAGVDIGKLDFLGAVPGISGWPAAAER